MFGEPIVAWSLIQGDGINSEYCENTQYFESQTADPAVVVCIESGETKSNLRLPARPSKCV